MLHCLPCQEVFIRIQFDQIFVKLGRQTKLSKTYRMQLVAESALNVWENNRSYSASTPASPITGSNLTAIFQPALELLHGLQTLTEGRHFMLPLLRCRFRSEAHGDNAVVDRVKIQQLSNLCAFGSNLQDRCRSAAKKE